MIAEVKCRWCGRMNQHRNLPCWKCGRSLPAPSGSASGLDMMTEIRRLRDALKRLERTICTNPSEETLQRQMDIITQALDETTNDRGERPGPKDA